VVVGPLARFRRVRGIVVMNVKMVEIVMLSVLRTGDVVSFVVEALKAQV
jgi:hypothetical protein